MEKTYNAKNTEDQMYQLWESTGAFRPSDTADVKPFTIIMPPPNANDPLHIGHAMFITIEDILIRYHRMKGDASLWLPGADHAGIETQFVFEKKLKKEGKSRFDFDRETLFGMIWDYVQDNTGIAKEQMKKIGASADWSRFTFTLDPNVVDLVIQTFNTLNDRGYIYRDLRLINYCTRCGTGYSELEAKHEVKKDPMVYIKYGPFTIATVRPETKFRDTALAVNPKDKRYKEYIGNEFEIQGLLGPITMKVVADPDVDPEFGTGIMKVTPAHDFHDFDLGKKYNLPVTPIIDMKGKMDFSWYLTSKQFASAPIQYQERAKQYHGLHVSKARPLMIEHLREDGLLDGTKADGGINHQYEHTVATCYRCGSTLEPLPLPQFFLKVKPMTEKVLQAMDDKKVKIHGPGYEKILKHWLENLKDWNISRQIVWGIRIPVWYEVTNHESHISLSFIDNQKQMHQGTLAQLLETFSLADIKKGLQQVYAMETVPYVVSIEEPKEGAYIPETDTFDTWFSSGQWPFATLKVNHPKDFDRFYPTQVMETAYDILVFWVMRMLMMGIEITGKVPFEHVYLHGLVRDEKGQKMSKSKGNVINPIDVIEKYGADALRMALVMSTSAGKDSSTGEEKIRGMRNFTNKIWNAARFIQLQNEQATQESHSPKGANDNKNESAGDDEFKQHIQEVAVEVTKQLDTFKIGLAAETVYQEFWHFFCDEAIEKNKNGEISLAALTEGLETFLRLLHPFVPFVTEAIWQQMPTKKTHLIISAWPMK